MPLYCRCAGDFDLTFSIKVSAPSYMTSFILVMKACVLQLFLFPLFHFKELLRADHGVSEHSVPLQHELPGGDHWLAAPDESTDPTELSLNGTPPLSQLFSVENTQSRNLCLMMDLTSVSILFDCVSCRLEEKYMDCKYVWTPDYVIEYFMKCVDFCFWLLINVFQVFVSVCVYCSVIWDRAVASTALLPQWKKKTNLLIATLSGDLHRSARSLIDWASSSWSWSCIRLWLLRSL